jgi:TRAP-type C4-dicarboxylate transport system permease small subunit
MKMVAVVDRVVEAIVAVAMVIMVASVSLQVYSRYVLRQPVGWTEEIARATLVWITFLGSYLVLRKATHIRISVLVDRFPLVVRRICGALGYLMITAVAVVLVRYGIDFTTRFGRMSMISFELPMGILYVVVPVSGVLFLIWSLEMLFRFIIVWRHEGSTAACGLLEIASGAPSRKQDSDKIEKQVEDLS